MTDKVKKAYYVTNDSCYLVGPNGFACYLGEPEDRTWTRDGALVVEELNRLYSEIKRA